MAKAPRTLQFSILTTAETSEAERQIVSFHGAAKDSLDVLQRFAFNLRQQVGMSAEEAAAQLRSLERVAELINRTFEETAATRVTVDTGDLQIAARDVSKTSVEVAKLIKQVEKLEALRKQEIAANLFKKEVNALFNAFRQAHPEIESAITILDKYSRRLEESGNSARVARAITAELRKELAKIAAEPVEYKFRIEPEITTRLKDITSGLLQNIEVASRAENSVVRLRDTISAISAAARKAASEGLEPLADRFQELLSILEKREVIARFSLNIEELIDTVKTSAQPFDEMSDYLQRLAAAAEFADESFEPLRREIQRLLRETEKRKGLVAFSEKLRELGEAPRVSDMKGMRRELEALYREASQTEGLEEVANSLRGLLRILDEGGGRISQFKTSLMRAADTVREKAGIDALVNELTKLQKKAEATGVDIEPLIANLRKLAISPKTVKSLENATAQLGVIAEQARTKVRRDISGLADSFGKFSDKIGETTRKGGGLVTAFQRMGVGISGLGKLFSDIQVQMSKFLIVFGVLGSIRYIVQDFTQAVTRAARGIFRLTEEAAKLRDAEVAFRRLTDEAKNANVILAGVYAETEGVIERVEAVGAATRAALAGLPMERFDQLARGARVLAAATGRDANEALERLTNAIAKQERRLLDELGIVIRAQDIYRDYARSIGVSTTELTAAQKRTAFFEAVLATVNEKVMALGSSVDLAQRPFKRLRAAAHDLQIAFGGFLERTLSVSSAISGATGLLDGLTQILSSTSERAAVAVSEVLKTNDAVKMFSTTVPEMIDEALALNEILKSTSSSTAEVRRAKERLREIIKALSGLFPEYANELKVDVVSALKALRKETLRVAEAERVLLKVRLREAILRTSESFDEVRKKAEESERTLKMLRAAQQRAAESADGTTTVYKYYGSIFENVSRMMFEFPSYVGGYRMSVKEIAKEIDSITGKTAEYNNMLLEQRANVATLAQVMIEMGEITEDDFLALEKLDKTSDEYALALSEVASKLRIQSDVLEDALELILKMIKGVKDLGDGTEKSAEEITKALDEIGGEWKKLGELVKKIEFEFDMTEFEKAQLQLEILRGRLNAFIDEIRKNARGFASAAAPDASAVDSSLDEIIRIYQRYLKAQVTAANIQSEAERRARQKDLDDFKAIIDERLSALGIEEKTLEKLIESRAEIAEAESKLREARAREITASARDEIKAREPVYESEIENSKRILNLWRGVKDALIRNKLEGTKEYDKVNELIQAEELKLAKALRKIEVESRKERMSEELEVLKTLSDAALQLPEMNREKAAELIVQLKSSSAELPPHLRSIVSQMERMLDELVQHNARASKEMRDNFIRALDEQYSAAVERFRKAAESYEELSDTAEKAEEAKIDFAVKGAGAQIAAEEKRIKILEGLTETEKKIAEMTSKKKIESAVKAELESAKAGKIYFDNREELIKRMLSLWRAGQQKISELTLQYERETLEKIAATKNAEQLESVMQSIKMEELSRSGREKVRAAEQKQFAKFLEDRISAIKLALAKQSGIEEIAREESIKGEHRVTEEKLLKLKEDLANRKGFSAQREQIDNMLEENAKLREMRISESRRLAAKKLQLEMMKYEKKTTENELKEAKLRIEINFMEMESKLRALRLGWQLRASLAKKGSDEETEALQQVEEIDKLLSNTRRLRDEALAEADRLAAKKAAKEKIEAYKAFVDFVGKASEAALNARLKLLEDERNSLLQLLEDHKLTEEQRAAISEAYAEKVKEIEREIWLATKGAAMDTIIAIMDAFEDLFESLKGKAKGVEKDMIEFYEGLKIGATAVLTTIKAYVSRQPEDIFAAAQSWVRVISTIWESLFKKTSEVSEEEIEKMRAENERVMNEMRDRATSMAQELSKALTEGLDVDFDQLIRNFAKAEIAKRIAEIMTKQLAGPLDELARTIEARVDPIAQARVLEGLYEFVAEQRYKELAALGKQPWEISRIIAQEEDELREKAMRQFELGFGPTAMAKRAQIMQERWREAEPVFRDAVSVVEDVFGELSDEVSRLEEQIPTATFRAVTEPQANQMLILLGRQTDYLSQIASNTAKLVARPQQLIPQREAAAGGVIAAAPTLDQNININERLEININGEERIQLARPEEMNIDLLAGVIAQRQQALIDQREVALGRSRIRTRRTR